MKRKSHIGVVAFVCGVLGLVGAVFGHDIAEGISPTPPLEEKIADSVVRVRDAVVAKLKDRNAKIAGEVSRPSLHVRILQVSLACAVLGVVGAAVSYMRREDRRIAYAAGGVAVVGLAWQAMMVALGVVIFCVILGLIMSHLDISPG